MSKIEQMLAEYKKFGVTYNSEENKVTIPATSGFEGMCGDNLKQLLRKKMDEKEIDHSDIIWLIDGDHDWKDYFAQVDAECKEDYSKQDLRIYKDHPTNIESDVEDNTPNISDMFSSKNGATVAGTVPLELRHKVDAIMKKYGCKPRFDNGHIAGWDIFSSEEDAGKIIEELKQIPGIGNIQTMSEDQFYDMATKNSKERFKEIMKMVPPHLRAKYENMEYCINELSFYGVHMDNMNDLTEIAKIAGSDTYFTAMMKEADQAVLISVPEDSILLYENTKAAGMEFASLVGKRIREDLFFGIDVKVRAKVRKGETWGIKEVAASGYILSKFYEDFDGIPSKGDYKSVD